MFLLIDLSEKKSIRLILFGEMREEHVCVERSHRKLLSTIDEALQSHGLDSRSISGIAVVTGSGSFTSTRLAITVANTFAYALRIPVVGVAAANAKDLPETQEMLRKKKVGQYVVAHYSGEPHIGAHV